MKDIRTWMAEVFDMTTEIIASISLVIIFFCGIISLHNNGMLYFLN